MLAGQPVLSLDQGNGRISSFEPVVSGLRRGDLVRQGDAIGVLASTAGHCPPDICLHWGVRSAGRYIDPLSLLPGGHGPAVLLPLPPGFVPH